MALPSAQKQWVFLGEGRRCDGLKLTEGPIPLVDDYGVLVKLHAAGLNHRDVLISANSFAFELNLPVVGGSDGAGEVVDIGVKVTKWQRGDRVATLFNPGHQAGPLTAAAYNLGGLGGTADGTFREYGVFPETALVRLASNLSYLEGASLPDAGVTAWNALYGGKALKPGEWVLIQGTGGVSLFAVQFAKAGGGRVVATTSSSEKAQLLKGLGADHVINYTEDPNWGLTARKLTTKGEGFDHILEVSGAETISHSLDAIKFESVISLIGLRTGFELPSSIAELLLKICTIRGVHVGSRELMEQMMEAIEANRIQPVLDKRVFGLDEIKEGLEYLGNQKHVGKVAVKIV